MDWNLREDIPIYSQLIYHLKVAVATGELKPGDKLSSVRDLALDAKVNPNTMQRALTELEREGILYTQRTSGRFVTEDTSVVEKIKESLAEGHAREYMERMQELGYTKVNAISHLR